MTSVFAVFSEVTATLSSAWKNSLECMFKIMKAETICFIIMFTDYETCGFICTYTPMLPAGWKQSSAHWLLLCLMLLNRDKRNSAFWYSVFLCSERRRFREKNIMKKRSRQGFFFFFFSPLLLNYFDCVAPGRWFPLPLLLPGSSSSFVKSFQCKKVNLLLLLSTFFLF